MRKSFRMFLALALVVLGAVSVKAQERISLQEVGFYAWDGWGGNAAKTGDASCEWGIGASTGNVYGDMSVKNFADLTLYSKLILTVTEGTPRVLFNRLKDEGQCGDTFEDSYLVDIPNKSWCTEKYQSVEGNVYTYDLKAIAKDYGFVHLHAIKGANWANVTVESAELEASGKVQQVGWTEITTNANLDGDDVANFVAKEYPSQDILPAVITDGVGVDGSRGIMVKSAAGATNDWDTQFWIQLNEPMAAGTKYRVTFDYRSSLPVSVATQAHATPGNYIHWEMMGNVEFSEEWKNFKYEGELTASQAANADGTLLFQAVAFNLSIDKENEVEFYFDNIRVEEYKYGVTAEYTSDVIELDFGFDTNLPTLVAACGKPRLIYPSDCATVTANGAAVEVESIEGFADGRFYIFLVEGLNDDDVVEVTFNNPADAAYHLTYDGGPGGDVKDFSGVATNNSDVYVDDAYAYIYVTPTLMSSDPEHGSFNLPNNISEFKATFDKPVDCAKLVATLNGGKLTVEPAEGFVESVVFKRDGGDLATGEYALNITNILPEVDIFEGEIFGDTTLVLNVGKVNLDPSDTLRQVLPDYFSATAAGGIPEGWYMVYDGSIRKFGEDHYSGANMKTFADGGDFTRGFYTRTNNDTPDQCIVEYGSIEGYDLVLEAGKKYKVSYNLAAWSAASYVKFEIYDPNGDVVYSRVDATKGDVKNLANSNQVASGTNYVEFTYYPEASGNYKVRWTPCNAEGNLVAGGMNEVLIANPKVTYMPNAAGVEETQALIKALEAAKSVLAVGQSNERYAGAALDALAATVAKYEAEYESYTNPSAYTNAIAVLDAAAKVMGDHRGLCDAYYALPEKAQQIVDDNASKKFAGTELYAQLKDLAAKYVTKEVSTVTETDPETGEPVEKEVVTLIIKTIIDDAELQAAIAELQEPVNTSSKLFTEGESKMAETGIKVLVERLRLGAESLKKLGVPADDELIVAVNNALTDDDELAEAVKLRLKVEIFGQLKETGNTLFEEKLDTNTLDTYVEPVDLTVFVKNPNIYRLQDNLDFYKNGESTGNIPGWIVPDSLSSAPGLSYGWSDPGYYISDCQFQTWGASYAVEQTVVDLPVGVYNIVGSFGERTEEAGALDGSYFYAKTSSTPEGEVGDTISAPYIGQSFPVDNITIPNVVVSDGMLTIGAVGGPASHTFFNQVKVQMVGAVEGFDYAAAYQEVAEGIEGAEVAPAKVLGVELYDLNGHRLAKAQRGIVIMKKYMSNGTIRVEKIIKR